MHVGKLPFAIGVVIVVCEHRRLVCAEQVFNSTRLQGRLPLLLAEQPLRHLLLVVLHQRLDLVLEPVSEVVEEVVLEKLLSRGALARVHPEALPRE